MFSYSAHYYLVFLKNHNCFYGQIKSNTWTLLFWKVDSHDYEAMLDCLVFYASTVIDIATLMLPTTWSD